MITSSTSSASVDLRAYLHQQNLLWNAIAIFYTFLGYFGSIPLLTLPGGWLNALGVVLLTHSLVFSAYLSHECMHGTIFKSRRWNANVGTVLLWLNGGCYYGFQALTLQHIAHHVDRADILTFDPVTALQQQPPLVRWGILALEWFYFPMVGFWSRWRSLTALFWNLERNRDRAYVVCILLIRGVFFAFLGILSSKALLLYFLSYIGMITLLRWMDAFQHTYEGFSPGTALPNRDRAHEQANTFSNLLSRHHPWLNLLFLNFGYHNAHHEVMKCPWHCLSTLDRELYKNNEVRYISLWQQIMNYHRFRITRLLAGQGQSADEQGNPTFENFYGAIDVSFLTLY